jgi:hypothetical protein
MGNIPRPVDENTDLAVEFVGEPGKVFRKFGSDDLARYFSPVDSFESVEINSLKS